MALSKAGLRKAAAGAFNAIGDVAEAATLRRAEVTYNTATGSGSTVNTDYQISQAVFTKFENFEVDKVMILSTDIKMLVQQSELTITPNIASDIIIRASKYHNIVRVSQDPASVLWIIQLRAP